MDNVLLEVKELQTQFDTPSGQVVAVDGLSFSLDAGKTLAIVGESGSGKTVAALSILGLIPPPGQIIGGSIIYHGQDLLKTNEQELEKIRGDRISMIFQDPMTSLNPVFTIGEQVSEGLIFHKNLTKVEARKKTIELLDLVGIPNATERYDAYPHEFSGGMRQRVLIAGAIACNPEILIADEPTTALDVTIQAQILKLLQEVKSSTGSSLILVTHDLGIVASIADEVMVMYAGRMVEFGDVETIFHSPRHPYTRGLLSSIVRLDDTKETPFRPIPGTPPDLIHLPNGCRFASRCSMAMDICHMTYPEMKIHSNQRWACYLEEK